jgi:hypothetical protein
MNFPTVGCSPPALRVELDGGLRTGDGHHATDQIGSGACRRMGMMGIMMRG